MKATDLLEQQHDDVSKLFEKIEDAKDDKTKTRLFEELAASLVAHDAIEREIFYPACEREMGMTDELGEALVEHGVVEFSLYQADQAQGEDHFEHKLKVLLDVVSHHVEEEEGEFFPKVEKALDEELLEKLGARMEARFDEAKEHDFRRALHSNLRQVLAGATKTKPNGTKASRASSASTRRRSV